MFWGQRLRKVVNFFRKKCTLIENPGYAYATQLCKILLLYSALSMCKTLQDAQLSQRDRAVGCVIVLAKSERTERLQPLWYNRPEHSSNSVKKRKIRLLRCSRSFKVIEVGTNRKPVYDFLLVINSNWHPISYCFGVIAAYYSNFWHFALLSHPLGGGLSGNVRCSSQAHWKARSGLPISDNWTFCWGFTNENRLKIGVL